MNCVSINNLSFSIESEKLLSDYTIKEFRLYYKADPEKFNANMEDQLKEIPENFISYMKLRHSIGIYEFIECECIIK